MSLFVAEPIAAQIDIGATISASTQMLFQDTDAEPDSSAGEASHSRSIDLDAVRHGHRFDVELTLYGGGETFAAEAILQAAAEATPAADVIPAPTGQAYPALGFEIPRLVIDWYPLAILGVRLGRFDHVPGPAELFRLTDLFGAPSVEDLLSTSGRGNAAPELLQLQLLVDSFYLRATVSGRRLGPPELNPNSLWFPRGSIPETYDYPLDDTSLVLGSISYVSGESAPVSLADLGGLLEFGGYVGPIEGGVFAHYGWDRSANYAVEALPRSLTSQNPFFNVEVTPVNNQTWSFGSHAQLVVDPVRIWLEARHRFGAIYNALPLVDLVVDEETGDIDFKSRNLTSSTTEAVIGAAIELFDLDLFGLVEARHGIVWDLDQDSYEQDPLTTAIAANLLWTPFQGRISLSTGGIIDLTSASNGISAAILPTVALDPTPQVGLVLSLPVFIGDNTTFLGSLSGNYMATASATFRF